MRPVADADRRTLIRRAYFDLIGLPPTPEEIDAFVTDTRPEGVREGRRPPAGARRSSASAGAGTGSTSPATPNRPARSGTFRIRYAWRYRDYVIDAFNADKPYDQFVREQIAGDLLPAEERRRSGTSMLTATGFLALGPKSLNDAERRAVPHGRRRRADRRRRRAACWA